MLIGIFVIIYKVVVIVWVVKEFVFAGKEGSNLYWVKDKYSPI
jgi:hypothetical protein